VSLVVVGPVWLVDLFECMMMHGLTNPKFMVPFFKGQGLLEDGTDRLSRNVARNCHFTLHKLPEDCTAVETRNHAKFSHCLI